jgi:sugar lactone lactonase YvrE
MIGIKSYTQRVIFTVLILVAINASFLAKKAEAVQYNITTIVGNGESGFSGDDGPAKEASLNNPRNFTIDQHGNIFVTDSSNNRIRKVDAATGFIQTVVGDGVRRFRGDGGPAIKASIGFPNGIFIANNGDIYFCDTNNQKIRKVTAKTGFITTIGGTGKRTFSGDNGPAALASMHSPSGITLDKDGNIFFSDTQNNSVRRIDGATGIIKSIAGKPSLKSKSASGQSSRTAIMNPTNLAIDNKENIFWVDTFFNRVKMLNIEKNWINVVAGNGKMGYGGDGGDRKKALLSEPSGVAVDSKGNIYIADAGNHRIRFVDKETGIITTIAGTGKPGYSGDNGPALKAEINFPTAVKVDNNGNIFFIEPYNNVIRKLTPSK